MEKNPLLVYKNDTDESFIRFDLIKDEHFEETFEASLRVAKENLKKIIENPEAPTFENSIEALEYMSEDLDRVSSIFTNLKEAHTSKELERVAEIVLPKLADFSNDLALNEILFSRVKTVYDAAPQLKTKEQQRLLEKTYKGFIRSGALLTLEGKEKLRNFDRQLVLLCKKFSENLLGATNAYELHISKAQDISGLPDRIKQAAREEAVSRGKDGWVITLKAPSSGSFLQYADNSELRREVSLALGRLGMRDPFDNKKILFDIMNLRRERALLFGYKSHAEFVLEDRMAKTPERVNEFFNNFYAVARPLAERDFEILRSYKEKYSSDKTLNPWDVSYYEEKLKKESFDFDEEEYRPYFKIESVVDGVFEHARRLYGLVFSERKDIPVYHKDVKAFEVRKETGEYVGLLYMDLFPRESKRGGGWIDAIRMQHKKEETNISPQLLIVCNLTKPTADAPSLLTSYEAETIFHEVGHGLHVLLSDCQYRSLAGFNTLWDFVELPSQLMQSWLTQKESFEVFAKHYQTGESLSEEAIEKLLKADRFMAAWVALAQLGASVLDMAWHTEKNIGVTDIEKFEEDIRRPYRFFPPILGTSSSTSFNHIIGSGYDSGYYSYLWSEVLAADAFEYFKENGIFSKEIAKKFQDSILSKGNTEEPLELYRAFRGRDADPKALFRHRGLI